MLRFRDEFWLLGMRDRGMVLVFFGLGLTWIDLVPIFSVFDWMVWGLLVVLVGLVVDCFFLAYAMV